LSLPFSYRHLYYFWVVGKEGGMSRAADRLGMAVQTVSTQVRELEQAVSAEQYERAAQLRDRIKDLRPTAAAGGPEAAQ